MTSPQGRRLAAAALLVCTGACASDPEPVDPETARPVVVNRLAGDAAPAAPEDALALAAARLESAEAAWRSGDALTALAIANAALQGGVPPESEAAFRELRAKARSAVVSSKVLRVRAVPDRDAVADGARVPLRIELRNVSGATLRVPRSEGGSSDSLCVLGLVREDYDVFGNTRRIEEPLRVPLEADVEIAPGGSHDLRVVVPEEATRLAHQGFSVLRVEGTFRPVALRVGQTELFDAIPIEAATVRVFLAGFEPLAADPLGSLRRAVEKRSPPHVLTCAELLAPSDRAAGREVLDAAAKADPALAVVCRAAAARLSAAAGR